MALKTLHPEKIAHGEQVKALLNFNFILFSNYIQQFQLHCQQPCQVFATKGNLSIRKDLNSHRIGLVRHHGCRFIVLE